MSGLLGGGGGLVNIKADLVLNAFRDQMNAGVSLQGMVDGFTDEFEDETGIDAASVNETYDAANDYYHNPRPAGSAALIPQGSGTEIGTFTNIDKAFDTLNKGAAWTASNYASFVVWTDPSTAGVGYIGKSYVGSPKVCTGWKAWGTSDYKLDSQAGLGSAGNTTSDVQLQGSNDGVVWNDIDSVKAIVHSSASLDYTGNGNTVAYRDWRLKVTGKSSDVSYGRMDFTELEFYGHDALVAPDMELISAVQTALSAPATGYVYLWQEDVDAVTLDADLIVYGSSDGGTTWDAGSLEEIALLSTGRLLKAPIGFTGGGVLMAYKISTFNDKVIRIHAVGMDWG